MDNVYYKFLSLYGQVNTRAIENIVFESINEKVLQIDEHAYGYKRQYPENYVYMEWIGQPEKLNEAQPLLGFLKNRLQSYMYPFEFTLTINLKEKGG